MDILIQRLILIKECNWQRLESLGWEMHTSCQLLLLLLFRCEIVSDSLPCHALQHARLLCPPLSSRLCSNLCPLSQQCCLTISSLLLSSPFAFNLSQHQDLFQWAEGSSHQVVKVSAPATVLSRKMQGWFPLGLTGLISVQSKGLSRVFSNTTVQKHQFSAFFMVQLLHPYMTTGKTRTLTRRTLLAK